MTHRCCNRICTFPAMLPSMHTCCSLKPEATTNVMCLARQTLPIAFPDAACAISNLDPEIEYVSLKFMLSVASRRWRGWYQGPYTKERCAERDISSDPQVDFGSAACTGPHHVGGRPQHLRGRQRVEDEALGAGRVADVVLLHRLWRRALTGLARHPVRYRGVAKLPGSGWRRLWLLRGTATCILSTI